MPAVEYPLAYARLGWPVFPCRGKIPCDRGSHGVNDATTDEHKIRSLWRRHPDANIGLAAGHAFFALDVDGHEGEESLRALVERYGDLPDTLTQFSGGGGAHLLFKAVHGLRNWAGRFCIGGEYVAVPGLDIRTAGAAIIGSPSIHPDTAKPYRWKKGHGPRAMLNGKIELADAPEWLVRIATPPLDNVVHFQPRTDASGAAQGSSTRYAEAAIVRACEAVSGAMPGTQEATLHREAYSLGGLVGAGVIPEKDAFDALAGAGMKMQSGNERWPWTARAVSEKVTRGLRQGMNRPRLPAEGRR